MPLPDNGLIGWPRQSVLAWIEVHDSGTRETVYVPDMDEIQDLCNRYGLGFDMISEAILKARTEIYGFLIVAETHREYLKKVSSK